MLTLELTSARLSQILDTAVNIFPVPLSEHSLI